MRLKPLVSLISGRSVATKVQLAVAGLLVAGSALTLVVAVPHAQAALLQAHLDGYQREADIAVSVLDEAHRRIDYPLTLGIRILGREMAGRSPEEASDEVVDATRWLNPDMVATVFHKEAPGKFIRQATTVKNKNGARAVGTYLANDAVTAAMEKGEDWLGKVELFGVDYLVRYSPIKDADDKVVGAYFVGLNATAALVDATKELTRIKVGKTGYFFALESQGPDKGELTLHPALVGKNLWDAKAANGSLFIQDMIAKGRGTVFYDWKNPGEEQTRDKFVAFSSSKPWGWTVAASGYVDDLTEATRGLTFLLAGAQVALVLVLLAAISVVLRFVVARPLKAVQGVLDDLAEGRINQLPAVARSGDEVANIRASLSAASARMFELVGTVRHSAEQSSVGSRELADANAELASRTEAQAATVEETSAATRSLVQAVEENSARTSQAAQLTGSATAKAQASGQVMQQVASAMSEIDTTSKAVAGIVSQISEIAQMTGLLALNAQIEAARAGEAGRGFAVVAQEVRNLASRTTEAAKSVDELVARSVSSSQAGAALVGEAVAAVAGVVEEIKTAAQAVDAVAASAAEQRTSLAEIASAVGQVDSVTQQNAAMVEEVSAAANALSEQAQALAGSVRSYQLNGND